MYSTLLYIYGSIIKIIVIKNNTQIFAFMDPMQEFTIFHNQMSDTLQLSIFVTLARFEPRTAASSVCGGLYDRDVVASGFDIF